MLFACLHSAQRPCIHRQMSLLLPHSRSIAASRAPAAAPCRCSRPSISRSPAARLQQQQRWQPLSAAAAAAGDAAAQPEQRQDAAAAAAPAPAQPAAAAAQDAEQPQHMVASTSSLGIPPGLMEPEDQAPQRLSASARLCEELSSTSIAIVGDDTELIWAVCQALSKKIGWFPVSTRKILLGLHKAASAEEIVEKEGRPALVEAEAKIVRGMRDQRRCCIATIGDGAAVDPQLYTNLYGSIIIWLDEEDKRAPKPFSSARSVYYQQSEVRAKLSSSKGGFGDKPQSLEDKASKATSQLVKAMLQLLKENDTLLARKRLYVEMGCRGDWPVLQPEDWNPAIEGLDRKAVA